MRALALLETLRAVNGRAVCNPALWLLVGLMRPIATIGSFDWGRQGLGSDFQVGAR
jgi:hypothetical protein